jgi:hypothetical protein
MSTRFVVKACENFRVHSPDCSLMRADAGQALGAGSRAHSVWTNQRTCSPASLFLHALGYRNGPSVCQRGRGGGRKCIGVRSHASKQASMHARVGSGCGSCYRGNGRPRGSRDVRKRLTSLPHCRAQQVESYTMGASRCEPGHAMRMCAAIVIAVAVFLPDVAVGHLEYFCVSSVFSNSSQYCNKAVLWLGTCESSLLSP